MRDQAQGVLVARVLRVHHDATHLDPRQHFASTGHRRPAEHLKGDRTGRPPRQFAQHPYWRDDAFGARRRSLSKMDAKHLERLAAEARMPTRCVGIRHDQALANGEVKR